MSISPALWFTIGIVLAVLEALMPGAFLVWFGIAAGAVGLVGVALPELDWRIQLVIFAAAAAIAVAIGLKLRRRGVDQVSAVNLGAARLIGQRATVATSIVNGRGEVSLGDTVWPATGPDLDAGTHVRVVSADGPVVTVERV
jgi:hypothetical protein